MARGRNNRRAVRAPSKPSYNMYYIAIGIVIVLCAVYAQKYTSSTHEDVHQPKLGRIGDVMAVDLGSAFVKLSLCRGTMPCSPQIVEDEVSKRKFPLLIGFDENTSRRFFGNSATSLKARDPSLVVSGFKHDQGLRSDIITRIEALSMIMEYSLGLGGSTSNHLILTAPVFSSDVYLRELLSASEISNLGLVDIISDGHAAAIQYVYQYLELPVGKHSGQLCIYDMGAEATQVTLVTYTVRNVLVKGKLETRERILKVIGTGYDTNLGGMHYTDRITHRFEEQVIRETGKAPSPDVRSRLETLANRVKEVLTVNSEFETTYDNLVGDYDFHVRLTREEFDNLTSDLTRRSYQPITRAIRSANIDKNSIDSVQMLGGGMRVPSIQALLKLKLPHAVLKFNLNSDETIASGAALYARIRTSKMSPFLTLNGGLTMPQTGLPSIDVESSRVQLAKYRDVDARLHARDCALNSLEDRIYRVRELVLDDTWCLPEGEGTRILDGLALTEEWVSVHGETAGISSIEKQSSSLDQLLSSEFAVLCV